MTSNTGEHISADDNLRDWEDYAVDGLYDHASIIDIDNGNIYAKKRESGDAFVVWD